MCGGVKNMKISTAEIKKLMIACAADGEPHSVADFKRYILENSDKEFTTGQISGAIYQLSENGELNNIERGLYKITSKAFPHRNEATNTRNFEKLEEKAEYRTLIKLCLEQTEQQLEEIVNTINVWKLTSAEFEFLGEIKKLNEQMKRVASKC